MVVLCVLSFPAYLCLPVPFSREVSLPRACQARKVSRQSFPPRSVPATGLPSPRSVPAAISPRSVLAAGLPSPLYPVANALWLYCACYIPPHYVCHFATITTCIPIKMIIRFCAVFVETLPRPYRDLKPLSPTIKMILSPFPRIRSCCYPQWSIVPGEKILRNTHFVCVCAKNVVLLQCVCVYSIRYCNCLPIGKPLITNNLLSLM